MTIKLVHVYVVLGAIVFVILLTLFVNFMTAHHDAKNERFKEDCIAQGGEVVDFEGWKPACVIHGEKFYR